ncbi:glycosyltransferase family 4 protein [Geobacillus stearothermophilus]|uniref:glycosyltransferase family 4 protein n=1 Tax=Geobacillus stearothermophilus TaxID=1422 RepID=UPI002E1E3035|nr:glycosyltransferase family 4 protein [Geobacillus stearothermophilus]
MRISYLIHNFGKSGGSIVLYNFMDNLVKRGYEVYAITPTKSYKWEIGMWKELISKENSVSHLNLKNIIKKTVYNRIKNYNQVKKFKTLYNLNKITKGLIENWIPSDITISTYCFTAYAGYYLSNRTVSLYHMQHFEEVFFQDYMDRMIARNTYYLPLLKISNSSWLKNIMKKYFNEETYLLNPGIDLNIFTYNPNFMDKYKEKKEWNIVSFFDETREWKGFSDAVQAVKKAREILEDKGYKINWRVFGSNPPTKVYDTQFEYVGQLFHKDLANFYAQSDIVLLTSWYESFPLPPIEAMATGSLIISTQYGVEDYLVDGFNGLVTLPRKIKDITDKIIWAIENPEGVSRIVRQGIETAKDYSWEKRTDVLEQIFNDAIKSYSYNNKTRLFDDLVNGKFKEYMYDEFSL